MTRLLRSADDLATLALDKTSGEWEHGVVNGEWNNRRDEGWVRPTVLHSPLDPTRARPEPWFVGSGRGLMILVISLCAVLLVVRGVTMVWMMEAAWAWFDQPSTTPKPVPAPPPLLIPPGPVADVPAPPPAPADVASRPEATVIGNPGELFSRDTYPPEALRRGEEGRVVARLAVGADGRPTGCTVIETSRSASLDRTTCWIGVGRMRFSSARDRRSRPIAGRYDLKVRWQLED